MLLQETRAKAVSLEEQLKMQGQIEDELKQVRKIWEGEGEREREGKLVQVGDGVGSGVDEKGTRKREWHLCSLSVTFHCIFY